MAASLTFASCGREEDETEVIVLRRKSHHQGINYKQYYLGSKNKYLLEGFVYVEAGATLTIEPGTIIKGDKSPKQH
ncbi:MAG: hypothetical protein IPJ39_06075 [Saprospiraceae bacterium]|nr:hypothetical protein [Saprospiraceae bacterium]